MGMVKELSKNGLGSIRRLPQTDAQEMDKVEPTEQRLPFCRRCSVGGRPKAAPSTLTIS